MGEALSDHALEPRKVLEVSESALINERRLLCLLLKNAKSRRAHRASTPTGIATPIATFPPVLSPPPVDFILGVGMGEAEIPEGDTVEYIKDVTVDPLSTCVT